MRNPRFTMLTILFALSTFSRTVQADGNIIVEPLCQQCQQGQEVNCENIDNSLLGKFRAHWAKKGQATRRWFYWQDQREKGLTHPECPPFLKPAWGYHETCWRRFPPTCPCPPAHGGIEVLPVPAAPSAIQSTDSQWQATRPRVSTPVARTVPASGTNWLPVSATATPRSSEKVWQLSDPGETMRTVGQLEEKNFLPPLVESEFGSQP